MVGALLGLAVVVKVLRWLLTHHEVMTLVVLTGLMTGGLRALWPWQSEHHGLLAPHGDIVTVMLLAVAGFVLVTALVVVDAWIVNRRRRTHATAAALDL